MNRFLCATSVVLIDILIDMRCLRCLSIISQGGNSHDVSGIWNTPGRLFLDEWWVHFQPHAWLVTARIVSHVLITEEKIADFQNIYIIYPYYYTIRNWVVNTNHICWLHNTPVLCSVQVTRCYISGNNSFTSGYYMHWFSWTSCALHNLK